MSAELPFNYTQFNDLQSKDISIVVEIPGLDLLGNSTVYTRVRYGDPDIRYGDADLIYGGLRVLQGVRQLLDYNRSTLTVAQRLEAEQGKGAISTMTLSFIDKDLYMTRACSPGIVIDEILGKPVKVWLGFKQISFPDDYFIIFRGNVSEVKDNAGSYTLTLSDPNLRRRQQVFFPAKSKLTVGLSPSDTTINILDNGDFAKQILGPNGQYDPGVKTYLKIEDEWIEYSGVGFGVNQFTSVTRGARGTTAATHAIGVDVSSAIQIEDHAIDMALKLMFSGYAGPWITGVECAAVVQTLGPDGIQAGTFTLPLNVDAIRDYGLVEGDYITGVGFTNGANNTTVRITRFGAINDQQNRIIYTTGTSTLVQEYPTSGTLSFRSQYDTYPNAAGGRLTPQDVDVQAHLDLKNSFLDGDENSYRFFLQDKATLKDFIELEIYLPVAAYSLTKRGKLSVGYTKPPLADELLVFLDHTNVIDPQNIMPMRSTTNRKFYNEIDWEFDEDDSGNFTSIAKFIDIESLGLIGVSSVLPIKSRGARTDLGTNTLFEKRSSFLLSRYKRGAVILDVKTFYGTASQIESGDVVALKDEGNLKIANWTTGERNIGTQLFEVINRTLDIKQGYGTLQLISGIGADVTDRYASISPSSVVFAATANTITIQDSYGPIFPGDEPRKWRNYTNQKIAVHDENYVNYAETTLLRLNPGNNYEMQISGGLPFTVTPGMIVDIPRYPTDTRKITNSIYKSTYCFFSAKVAVASGISTTQFTVPSGQETKFFEGAVIRISTEDYSTFSGDVTVASIAGTTITLTAALSFTPNNTMYVTGIGFADTGGFYRYI